MSKYVAAIDQGTTSTRCMVFDHSGRVVSVDQKEHEQIFPQPGWVEHDANEVWTRTQEVIEGALKKGGLSSADIAAVGVTNQRETTVLWDKTTGKPVHNAIVWQDTRTDRLVDQFAKDGGQDRFRQKTGLPLATYFSGPKIRWLLDNVDGLREKAESGDVVFGNMDSWVVWNLTGGVNGGVHVTDPTNASRTMLMDLETLDWDDELCDAIGVPKAMLPEIKSSSMVYANATGALDGIPVAGILGDQQAAVFGQTCFSVGEAKNTYGTGNFLLLNTGTEAVQSKNGLLTTVGYKIGDQDAVYCLEGAIAVTGSLVQWLRDNLGMFNSAPEIEALARTVDDNGGSYFVPAFSGLFAPYWRSDARGAIVGPHAVRQQGPHRPRGARGHGLPDQGSRGRDECRLRRCAQVAQGGRRHGAEQPAHAVPGRHPGRAGDPAGGCGDDLAGSCLCRRACGWLLGRDRGSAQELGEGSRVGSADGRGSPHPRVRAVEEGGDSHIRLGRR